MLFVSGCCDVSLQRGVGSDPPLRGTDGSMGGYVRATDTSGVHDEHRRERGECSRACQRVCGGSGGGGEHRACHVPGPDAGL